MTEKILIVDDEKDLRETLAEMLRESGYEVSEAIDGEKGLQMSLEVKPDLILLDIMMPIMDGHEMLRQLRRDDWGKDAKVLMLTAASDPAHVTEAVVHGGDDYIIKSTTPLDELLKKVKQALAGYE